MLISFEITKPLIDAAKESIKCALYLHNKIFFFKKMKKITQRAISARLEMRKRRKLRIIQIEGLRTNLAVDNDSSSRLCSENHYTTLTAL